MTLIELFSNIANSIRSKDGTTEPINATDFPSRIKSIPSGGEDYLSQVLNRTLVEYSSDYSGALVAPYFYDQPNLERLFLKNIKSVPQNAFWYCRKLEHIDIRNIEGIGTYCFYQCYKLNKVDLHVLPKITNQNFWQCTSLNTIILRNKNGTSLGNVNAFDGTPFRNGEGGIAYVPQALIDSGYYQNDTNWSALESITFLPLEGSPYEDVNWYESEAA